MSSVSYLLVVRRPAGGCPLVNCRLFIEYDTCTAGWVWRGWFVQHCCLSGAISSDCWVVITVLVHWFLAIQYWVIFYYLYLPEMQLIADYMLLLLSVCFVIYWQWIFIAFYLHIVYLCVVTTDTTCKHFTWMRVSVGSSSYLYTVYSLYLHFCLAGGPDNSEK